MQKRTNPFAAPLKSEPVAKKPEIVEEEVVEEEIIEEYVPVQTYVAPKHQRVQQKPVYVQPQNNARDKYTSTMDQELRRKIRIECARRGILFKTFVEQACIEKLQREGVK